MGEGIGTVAAQCMMEYALQKIEINALTAETHESNVRAQKMLHNLGFEEMSREGAELYLGVVTQLIQYRLGL